MFCDYCRRLFTFQQGVLPYTPKQSNRKGLKDSQGSDDTFQQGVLQHTPRTKRENLKDFQKSVDVRKIESSSSTEKPTTRHSEFEVYEDVRDIFTPQLVWWKTKIHKDGLQKGETHAPSADCSICDMIYSNVSSSFVEALLGKEKDDVAFVYQLKNEVPVYGVTSPVPEAMVSVWLEVGEKLLPMVKLKVSGHDSIASRTTRRLSLRSLPSVVESSHTGSEETLALAASWVKQCNTQHPKCTHLWVKQSPFLPTRLIDIGTLDGSVKPHLWIPENGHKHIPYITLSYRWGKSPAVLLTQASLPLLCKEIPIQLLPQTNQDAIKITRFLGVRYLWIDAICIIQDLDTDWQNESENMGNIYHNSYCTISASMAATGERGCFMNRRPLQARLRPCGLTNERSSSQNLLAAVRDSEVERQVVTRPSITRAQARRIPSSAFDILVNSQGLSTDDCRVLASELRKRISESPRSTTLRRTLDSVRRYTTMKFTQELSRNEPEITIRAFQKDLWASEVDASPLSRRAWTLQERILSPRILHFGKTQVFWECQVCKASETWPHLASKSRIDKLSKMLPDSSHALSGVAIYPLATHWHEIVQLYTDATLTRAEDKLVAISGIVKQILRGSSDIYFAGLWKSDFARSLLWSLQSPQRTVPTAYRAPSWSWASVDGRVEFLVGRPRPGYPTTAVSTVQTINTTGIDGKRSSTGRIKEGFCRILGPTRTALRYERFGNEHRLVLGDQLSGHDNMVDFFPDSITKNRLMDLKCLPLFSCYYETNVGSENNEEKEHFIAGLVIQPTGEFRDEYSRVGVFRISEDSGRAWFAGSDTSEVTLV